MEEAERLCNRIGIIDNGEIIAHGTLDELRTSGSMKNRCDLLYKSYRWKLQYNRKRMEGYPAFLKIRYIFSMNIQGDLSKIILMCNKFGLDMQHIDIQKINLETIF